MHNGKQENKFIKTTDLKNIFVSDDVMLSFLSEYKIINKRTGCYYMGYFIEDTRNLLRAGFTTNIEWAKEYLGEYINECHLWPFVNNFFNDSTKNNTSLVLPWSTIMPGKNIQKDIILRREEMYIGCDGVSFCQKKGDYREYYYFAPEFKQRRFLVHLTANLNVIRACVNVFRQGAFATIKKELDFVEKQGD